MQKTQQLLVNQFAAPSQSFINLANHNKRLAQTYKNAGVDVQQVVFSTKQISQNLEVNIAKLNDLEITITYLERLVDEMEGYLAELA
jgi:hypothetical protein